MNQSKFLAILCNSLKAWKTSRVPGATGFGFTSHWLKNWRVFLANRNRVITFDSHLKTALNKRLTEDKHINRSGYFKN